jgi:C1A family cysteine protease
MPNTNRGLGRLHAPDARDHNFLLARPSQEASQITYRTWFTDQVFDQGSTSQCVAYATIGWLMAGPVRNTKQVPSFREFYADCQRNDEWPGEEPAYEGTSVRASMKCLKQRGYVSEYRWAFNAATVIDHILANGPAVIGINWYGNMFDPDKNGFLHVGGQLAGGHAILLVGANRDKLCPDGSRGSARIVNSWSRQWGQSGRAWISFTDLDRLMGEDGEAATATEIVKVTA